MRLAWFLFLGTVAYGQMFRLSKEQLAHYTPLNPYERLADGRPRVPDELLDQIREITVAEAVGVLEKEGYPNQFVGELKALKPGQKLVGRAYTASYIPMRPDLEKVLVADAEARGQTPRTNNKVIDELGLNDVPVIDLMRAKPGNNFGGDNLHAAIVGATRTGAVVWGTIRDLVGIYELPTQVFFLAGHPAAVASVSVLGINTPVHIGPAVVMPGDVVLGDRTGVVFIPPHLVEKVLAGAGKGPRLSDSRNTNIPDTNTHFRMRDYKSLAEWEARKKQLREQILFSAGLEPMPEKTPMRSEIFGKLDGDDYTIEKVLLETRPGYWLGGNLYRPKKPGRHPAIASPHGHWLYGRIEHQPLGSIPARGVNLARQGYVVMTYDMVGYNDTVQTPHSFGGKKEDLWSFGPLGLQLWNSIRVVDFLETLPDVDKERIGATGASGGGTQTFLLAAVDDRVKFSAPVNMISAIMQGGSPCENAPGLRVGAFNVEIGAMMAPRPMLMVSATGDWTRNTLEEEFPAIRRIYDLYGKGDEVEAVRIDAPHNYNRESREAVYRFFARKVLGATNLATYAERSFPSPKAQELLALHGRTLPAGALDYQGVFAQWRTWVTKQIDAIGNLETRRRLLQLAIGTEWPVKVAGEVEGERIVLTRRGAGDRIPGLWYPGKGQPVLVVAPEGAAAARKHGAVEKLLAARRPVLLIDAFQTGAAVAPRDRTKPHFLTFNRSDDALRAQDIVTAVKWLVDQHAGARVELIGVGRAAVWSRFAAAVMPVKVTLQAPVDPLFQGSDDDLLRDFDVPHIQRAGGWRSALLLTK
jgi:regulator of RNase E activity RraA/dienelactone hydrolase